MSDKMRYKYRDINEIGIGLVFAAVDSATVIEMGDLVWQGWSKESLNYKSAFPASMMPVRPLPKGSSLRREIPGQTACRDFADNFLGVAVDWSRIGIGDSDPIRVATTGVFEFDCPRGTFELGDRVGIRCVDGVGQLVQPMNQQVVKVADLKVAIGCVARYEHSPSTTVLVDIWSAVMGRRMSDGL